ncbi:MAG: hypothetical protein ACTSPY_05975 [Candidatus Helarchaeota archaeon]
MKIFSYYQTHCHYCGRNLTSHRNKDYCEKKEISLLYRKENNMKILKILNESKITSNKEYLILPGDRITNNIYELKQNGKIVINESSLYYFWDSIYSSLQNEPEKTYFLKNELRQVLVFLKKEIRSIEKYLEGDKIIKPYIISTINSILTQLRKIEMFWYNINSLITRTIKILEIFNNCCPYCNKELEKSVNNNYCTECGYYIFDFNDMINNIITDYQKLNSNQFSSKKHKVYFKKLWGMD